MGCSHHKESNRTAPNETEGSPHSKKLLKNNLLDAAEAALDCWKIEKERHKNNSFRFVLTVEGLFCMCSKGSMNSYVFHLGIHAEACHVQLFPGSPLRSEVGPDHA